MSAAGQPRRGVFISFEGTEGAGKSTQIPLLQKRLIEAGYDCITLREPGGTVVGEEIRQILKHSASGASMTPETELLLMNASRAQLVREVIRPALEQGKVVLCDRFFDSTFAYQGAGRGLDMDQVRTVVRFAIGDIRPCRTLLLRVPTEVSRARQRSRSPDGSGLIDRFEEADLEFFRRVEAAFDALANCEPERIHVIDGTGSVEEVHARVWEAVAAQLELCATGER